MWLGLSQHLSADLDGVEALPAHGEDWAAVDSGHEVVEERFAPVFSIVLLDVLLAWEDHFGTAGLETAVLESAEDFTDEASLDSVGFDHDESLLGAHL